MRLQLIRRLGALTLGVLGALSCSESNGPGTGKLSLLLTATPGATDITAGMVTISQIYLQGSGGTVVLRDLRDDPVTRDLLSLDTEVADLVKDVPIPAGTYTQLRIVISDAYIVVENPGGSPSIYASSLQYAGDQGVTATGSLQMPSFEQSGLKVILPGNALSISDGGATILLLDFEVEQSFGHQAGNSGQWVMHPVIKATEVTTGDPPIPT